jgi:hypothetical protein
MEFLLEKGFYKANTDKVSLILTKGAINVKKAP